VPKKTNLDPSNLLEEDPEFIQFAKIFGRYFYRPNPGFPPFGPLTPQDAFIPVSKLAAIFRHCQKHNENPNPEVLMGSLQLVGFWLGVEFNSPWPTAARDALKKHLYQSFCATLKEIEIFKVQEDHKHDIPEQESSEPLDSPPQRGTTGPEPTAKVEDRTDIIKRHIKKNSDWAKEDKRKKLVAEFKSKKIPTPRDRYGLEQFPGCSWDDLLLGKKTKLDRVVPIVNRWRWSRKTRRPVND